MSKSLNKIGCKIFSIKQSFCYFVPAKNSAYVDFEHSIPVLS